tara:strand:- start:112 stop:1449 length:1338 start_codon:yes stop_codon:yes gene_type:complete
MIDKYMPIKQLILGLLVMLVAFIVLHSFMAYFPVLSENVFEERLAGYIRPLYEFILGIFCFLIFTFIVLFGKNKKLAIIWIVKGLIVTQFVMILYESNYSLDAFHYANQAIDKSAKYIVFGGRGSDNVAYINYLFTNVLGDSYYSLKMASSFFGFIGLVFFYKAYVHIMNVNGLKVNPRYIYILFFFPSILFWSSILGKDPFNTFFVGMFVYGFVKYLYEKRFKYILFVVFAMVGVFFIRAWWPIIMLITIFLWTIKLNKISNMLLAIIGFVILLFVFDIFLSSIGIGSTSDIFHMVNSISVGFSRGDSAISVNVPSNAYEYFLYFIPNLFTTLFRPMPWDVNNLFMLISSFENIILFYFSYFYIFKEWRIIINNRYLKFLTLIVFSWSLLYVLISPYNLGGAVRFKLQVLPLILIIIFSTKTIISNRRDSSKTIAITEKASTFS